MCVSRGCYVRVDLWRVVLIFVADRGHIEASSSEKEERVAAK